MDVVFVLFLDYGSGSGESAGSGSQSFSEVKDDKCEPNPCKNGGTCSRDYNLIDGYRCDCADDFGGFTCGGRIPTQNTVFLIT